MDCEYLSIATGDPEGRLIYPHTFVKAANRWHVRAFCERRQQFRDFVLSRFQSVDYDGKPAQHGPEADSAWNEIVVIQIAPDPRLNRTQKAIIERDLGMQNGQLVIQPSTTYVHCRTGSLENLLS